MEQQKKTLIALERDLFEAYMAQLGKGHSVTRQFKALLMSGPRAGETRRMLIESEATLAKTVAHTPVKGQPKAPAQSPLQPQQPAKVSPVRLPEPTQHDPAGGEAGAAEDETTGSDYMDFLAAINSGTSNVQLAAKYSREQLLEFARKIGATVAPEMSEKQIVAAAKKGISEK